MPLGPGGSGTSHPQGTTPLAKILPGVLSGLRQPQARVDQETMQELWRRLAGEEAAAHSWPRRLVRRRVLVEVDSSGWMHALWLRRAFLLEGLIECLGARRVRDLGFRIGEQANKTDAKTQEGERNSPRNAEGAA